MKVTKLEKDAAVVFHSKKAGEIYFTQEEIQLYGKDTIIEHIKYMDQSYNRRISDPRALILGAMSGKWWIDELESRRVPTIEETEKRAKREKAHKALVIEQKKSPKYHEEAQKFFDLRKRII